MQKIQGTLRKVATNHVKKCTRWYYFRGVHKTFANLNPKLKQKSDLL